MAEPYRTLAIDAAFDALDTIPSMFTPIWNRAERAVDAALLALQAAGYYVACGDCNSSVSGIHYVGCPKATSAPSQPAASYASVTETDANAQ